MRAFDFSPLYRSTIGFDQLANLFDSATRDSQQSSYPPYNIERTGEASYRITMAVAGFGEKDLNIELKQDQLTITGKRETTAQEEANQYLYQGIAARSFERRFQLADHLKVTGAALENGLLHVDLVREIPEEMKPRQILIKTEKGTGKTIEGVANAA